MEMIKSTAMNTHHRSRSQRTWRKRYVNKQTGRRCCSGSIRWSLSADQAYRRLWLSVQDVLCGWANNIFVRNLPKVGAPVPHDFYQNKYPCEEEFCWSVRPSVRQISECRPDTTEYVCLLTCFQWALWFSFQQSRISLMGLPGMASSLKLSPFFMLV